MTSALSDSSFNCVEPVLVTDSLTGELASGTLHAATIVQL